jgi:chitinase
VAAVRDAFHAASEDFVISMATPVNTATLSSGYDLPSLASSLDFFNILAYDIHGIWDSPMLVGAHTDIQYIEDSVQYMLGAGVPSQQLVVGLAAYGRTYTLSNASCKTVGCGFSGAGPGGCAGEDGYMPFFTIDEFIQSGNYSSLQLNPTTGSMELVIEGNKWISFDNQETFQLKASMASKYCLGGYMWWAVDMLKDPIVLSV